MNGSTAQWKAPIRHSQHNASPRLDEVCGEFYFLPFFPETDSRILGHKYSGSTQSCCTSYQVVVEEMVKVVRPECLLLKIS